MTIKLTENNVNKNNEASDIADCEILRSPGNEEECETYLWKNLPRSLRLIFHPAIFITIACIVEISFLSYKFEIDKSFSNMMTGYGNYLFLFIALAMLANLTGMGRFMFVRYAFVLTGYFAVSLILSTLILLVL